MAQALPSEDIVARRVLRLHERGVSPSDIARRQNMTTLGAIEILGRMGIHVDERSNRGRCQSVWSDDDEDEIRRRIHARAAAGARARLKAIARGE